MREWIDKVWALLGKRGKLPQIRCCNRLRPSLCVVASWLEIEQLWASGANRGAGEVCNAALTLVPDPRFPPNQSTLSITATLFYSRELNLVITARTRKMLSASVDLAGSHSVSNAYVTPT